MAFFRSLSRRLLGRPHVTFVTRPSEEERRIARELWLEIQHASSDAGYKAN
ncbi:MAG TPA: hypothetical protein VGF69_23200 [Thermoanaerobaculia bacterium]